MMTEKLALQIAYNILCDELDRIEDNWEYADTEYKAEIEGAVEKIKKMIEERK